jgi:hypothetical protein
MKCTKCGKSVDEKGKCPNCAAPSGEPSAGWGEVVGTIAVIGAVWLGKKILERAAPGAPPVGGLPPEFQETRSRMCFEIPGDPAASAMAGLADEMEKRQHQAQIGKMWVDHARDLSRIWLGLRT